MKTLIIALVTLFATTASAAPSFPSGRYSGTAVIIIDQAGCVALGKCPRTLPMNFSFKNNGNTGTYVNSKGLRATLKRSANGKYGAIIDRGGNEHCSTITTLNLVVLNGRNAAGVSTSIFCDDGSQAVITYLGFPRKVG